MPAAPAANFLNPPALKPLPALAPLAPATAAKPAFFPAAPLANPAAAPAIITKSVLDQPC